ncbi:acyl-CoA dehydrogenase [Streptomyces klenkii]|uniref:acyl-CoA dehydrogenase family protein n=1 Tax=Streptomyces klenkii TaxID=1420899 RepID=UPI0033BC7EEC
MTSHTRPAPAAGSLDRLLHGDCPPDFLDALHRALARHGFQVATEPGEREEYLDGRLRTLHRALPPAHLLLRDTDRLAAVVAWTAVADPRLCMSVITHTVLCLGSMVRLGADDPSVRSAAEALASADARGSCLVTEAGRANSHLATRTEAVFDPRDRCFVLSTPDAAAAKFGAVPAGRGRRLAVVLARTIADERDHGVFPFLVDLTGTEGTPLPGVGLSPPLELNSLPLTFRLVSFHGVRVPYAAWLRDGATVDAEGTLHDPLGSPEARLRRSLCVGQELWGALPSAAAATARQATVLALRHARARITQGHLAPGAPLFAYRSQQRALLGALADAFALTCAAARARELLGTSPEAGEGNGSQAPGTAFAPWPAVSLPLSAYKAYTVRGAERVVTECRRRGGWPGLLDVNRLPGYQGFHQAFEPAGGDSRLILYDIGRSLADAAPSAPRPARTTDPADPTWWPSVLGDHEDTLARQLRRARDHRARQQHDDFAVWNPLLDAAGELGETYAARLAAEDVHRALEHLAPGTDPPLREALEALGVLSGVRAALRRAGSLLTARTLRPRDLDPLPGLVDSLCDRVLPQLPALEACFGFPDDIAGAP